MHLAWRLASRLLWVEPRRVFSVLLLLSYKAHEGKQEGISVSVSVQNSFSPLSSIHLNLDTFSQRTSSSVAPCSCSMLNQLCIVMKLAYGGFKALQWSYIFYSAGYQISHEGTRRSGKSKVLNKIVASIYNIVEVVVLILPPLDCPGKIHLRPA